MKKLTRMMVIAIMMVLCSATVVAADAESEFKEAYTDTMKLTNELFDGVTEVLSGEAMEFDTLIAKIDKLLIHSKTLRQSAREMGMEEAADEARQMAAYLTQIKQAIQTGEKKHQLALFLARYYLHFNNCVMVTPIVLKEILHHHVERLKKSLEKGNMHEISHNAEHLHVHSDQMYYAALIFGKKIWQKFSNKAKANADAILDAAQEGDMAAIQTRVEKIEKPVTMLKELIK